MRTENGIYTYNWNPNDEDGPMLKITKSSLGSFGFCRLNYKYGYIDNIKQATSDAMLKGTHIHDAREKFWDDVDIKKAQTLIANPMDAVNYFRELYGEAKDDSYEQIYTAMAAYDVERLMESIEENALGNYIPVGNEIMLDGRFTTDDGVTVHLQGIIDRMFLEDGGYLPFELKTGAWKDSKKTMMRKEMAFYKLLYECADDEQKIKLGLDPNIDITHWGWFYPASNYVYGEKASKRTSTAVLRSIDKLIAHYKANEFPADFFIKKCVHCGHYDHCEAVGGGNGYDFW